MIPEAEKISIGLKSLEAEKYRYETKLQKLNNQIKKLNTFNLKEYLELKREIGD